MRLFDFANCGRFDDKIEKLKAMAMSENWGKTLDNKNHPVLHNYIFHYFQKVYEDNLVGYSKDENGEEIACFNTGLLTSHFDDIYAYFVKNKKTKPNKQEWFLADFVNASSSKLATFASLPDVVKFFNSIDDLYYDTSLELRINAEHIVKDNFERFPNTLKQFPEPVLINMIEGALKSTNKRIRRNYKTAVPQYFNSQIQFLIPLGLTDPIRPDIVIAVYKREQHYYGATCLTMEMAYNNARLLVKPESDWLIID
ncbi:MAG: DUF3825 domain-containing protein [Bacteroidales bacterium]|jgi:hypothetical protein|nr:DUF3825 domain-containing protein [Bacteroidales bacterium]